MAFYVPLGHRGVLLRFGTCLIGLLGSWVYWRASRRRGMIEGSEQVQATVEGRGD